MKQFTFNNDNPAMSTANTIEVQQHMPQLLGRTRLVPGLTLFLFNKQNGQIEKVDMESEYRLDGSRHHKVTHEKNCVYIQALNLKNAGRKFRKLLN